MKARRGWAWPLVPLYAAGLRVKDGLRAVGLLRVKRLEWPVVSVGSLSAGGAGKTPVVIALAELLQGRGWAVDVLSRGYGRESREVLKVDASDRDAVKKFGDEPVLIAGRGGVEVWVGADRFAAGMAAEGFADHGAGEGQEYRQRRVTGISRSAENDRLKGEAGVSCEMGAAVRRVHLLDDGFQHRQLARRVDVVLVTAEDLEDVLLPAGNLRERLAALRRADVVVLRAEEQERVAGRVRALAGGETSIWIIHRRLSCVCPEPGASARLKVVAFCGIARPEGFWSMLRREDFDVVKTVAFEDHHAYTMEDMERLVELARENGASGFVMTEKDEVKISAAMRSRLRPVGPVVVARLEVSFADGEGVLRDLEGRIE